jgi:hypothetical protein
MPRFIGHSTWMSRTGSTPNFSGRPARRLGALARALQTPVAVGEDGVAVRVEVGGSECAQVRSEYGQQ